MTAIGLGGQRMVIVPAIDLVMMVTAGMYSASANAQVAEHESARHGVPPELLPVGVPLSRQVYRTMNSIAPTRPEMKSPGQLVICVRVTHWIEPSPS